MSTQGTLLNSAYTVGGGEVDIVNIPIAPAKATYTYYTLMSISHCAPLAIWMSLQQDAQILHHIPILAQDAMANHSILIPSSARFSPPDRLIHLSTF